MKAIAWVSAALWLASGPIAARGEVVRPLPGGEVVSHTQRGASKLDFARAKAMPLPISRRPLPSRVDMVIAAAKARPPGPSMVFSGGEGSGKLNPASRAPLKTPDAASRPRSGDDGVGSQEYGTSNQVYMTSRVPFATAQPYRKAGKLFFQIGGSAYCSASMVKRGVLVTAAHCVYDWGTGGNQNNFYSDWNYVPAYKNGKGPYGTGPDGSNPDDNGTFAAATVFITSRYYNNTDTCYADAPGVVCDDDVALIVLKPDSTGKYAGDYTGWFSYAINSYAFSSGQAQITQLGYPGNLDDGEMMERSDSRGLTAPSFVNNTVIGSLMTEGSSGGPWLVNFGSPPVLDAGVTQGFAPVPNVVVGVTSWGHTDQGVKQQGAAPFLATNIKSLMEGPGGACATYPAACK